MSLKRFGLDGFLLAMLGSVALAILAPKLGLRDGALPFDKITQYGIALVFLLHGAGLSREALKAGATKWRLHLFVQASTFVLFPLIGFGLFYGLAGVLPADTRLGLFYLCALCSTISSSVAMVALARGDVAAAVFDASLSGLIGMVVTPLLVGLVVASHGGALSIGAAIRDIALSLLLPFAVGHLLRPLIGPLVARYKRWTTLLDRSVILLIVFASFSRATAQGLWSHYEPISLALVAALVIGLLAVVLVATTFAARALGFSREDEIVAVFCGSKKSLANGAPIARLLFGTSAELGMILLPLLLCHQAQLLVCAWLARRYAERHGAGAGGPIQPFGNTRHV